MTDPFSLTEIPATVFYFLFYFPCVTLVPYAVYRFTGSSIFAISSSLIASMTLFFVGIIPLWVAFLTAIVCVLLYIGGFWFSREEGSSYEPIYSETHSNELFDSSHKYKEYWNNLDDLLGIKTKVVSSSNLILAGGVLHIPSDKNWYIVGKDPNKDIFKIVGVSKKGSIVYLLGIDNDGPFLQEIDRKHLLDDYYDVDPSNARKTMAGLLLNISETILLESIVSNALGTEQRGKRSAKIDIMVAK